MKKCIFQLKAMSSVLLLLLLFTACKDQPKEESVTELNSSKPNIIYILADDLGYGELGAYGQEKIETPNIDALAKEGMTFTQHYTSAPVCAPARCMLLTGKHSGRAFVRGNHEWGERGKVWDYREMAKDSTLEGQLPMPDGTITFAKKLQESGYKTSMYGKWGLGAPHTNSIPTKMGFDEFFGYNCQRQAHTYYPLFLYKNEKRVHLKNDTIAPNTRLAKGADPYDMESYKDFNLNDYSPDLMFDEMTSFVERNKENPFFIYWASPIPHAPLQAPQRWVDYYVKKFGDEEPYLGNRGYFPNRYPHATYAAMISYLDENIGKLVQKLKDEGIYENTLIVFTSDNGPTYNGGVDPEFFDSAKPFKSTYGYGKGFVNEGGIRVPMIASWPGKIKTGSKTDHVSAHYDMFATLSDLVGYENTENDGVSFLPTLLGQDNQEEHEFMYWEFPLYDGQIAIRMGDWKVIRKNIKNPKKEPTLELYNLSTDPTESNNVADQHPDILEKAAKILKEQHTTPEVDRFKIPMLEKGLLAE
ncbi:arylsulfatase [Zhouia amylolytica]|nr:arylsulfatase [Zhouia amylolytica]